MKKAIVTGATGFIGKFLVRELVKQNVEVIAVVRRGTKNLNTINALPVKIVECNIADYHMLPDMIADRDIDVVFHIAWQGVSDLDARNEAIQMQNLQSTLDLIDAMHIMRIGCFIGCGSMHEAESLVEMNEDKVISNLGYMYKAICLFVYTLKSNWHNKGLAVIGRKCSTWLYIIHPIFITAFSVATGKLGIKSIYRCVAPIVTYCATLTFLIVMCRLKSLLVKNNQRK